MFKFIQDNKIKEVRENDTFNRAFYVGEFVEDTEHTVDDYAQYNDEYLLKSDIPAPTLEEQKEKRARAYAIEVDPITSHIQRLRNESEPDEQRIAELIQERAEKVAEIQERYPYPEGEVENG